MQKLSFLFWAVVCCTIAQQAQAQRFALKGVVADSTNLPVPFATVALMKPADSTLLYFTNTEENGAFEFKKIEATKYLLKINYVGYQPFSRIIQLKENTLLDTLKLSPLLLNEVKLVGERDPVRVAQDTVEFNAGSFKTRANASVEDLLKKLPGVQVDAQGNIKAQGQAVQKVLVNGKEFFGGDPKMATKNLPADAIGKVQIIEQKSDQAKLSGVDDGQNSKVINIETKDQNKRMTFGKLMAGYGSDERYEAKGNLNTFNKKNQFSVIGMGNNINNTGFSYEDYRDFNNRGQQGSEGVMMFSNEGAMNNFNFGSGNNFGFMRNIAGGLNLNQSINSKIELNGSYFLSHARSNIEKLENSETFLTEKYFATNQTNNQNSQNLNHRVNASLNYKIDSLKTLKIDLGGSFTDNNLTTNNIASSLTNGNILTNESKRDNLSKTNTLNYRANVLYMHKFIKKGRSFSINLSGNHNDQRQNGNLQARNVFFNPDSLIVLNQENIQNNYAQSYNTRTTYTEPLSDKKALEFNHVYQINLNDVKREVFDIENEQQKINVGLSNTFDNIFEYHQAGASVSVNEKKYRFSFGVGGQFSHLKGNLASQTIERRFENFLPRASFNYKFSKQKSFGMNYNTSVREPNVTQLQPVANNTNPLNIIQGNPNLRPAYTHRVNTHFNSFNPDAFSHIYSFVSLSYTTNNIVNEQTISDNLARTSRPVNTKGAMRFYGSFTYGLNLKKLKSEVDFSLNGGYNQSINILNNVTSYIHQQNIEGSIGYHWELEDMVNFSFEAGLDYQQTKYDFNPNQNQQFLNENYMIEAEIDALEFVSIQAELDYQINRGITNDFYQELPLLNAAIVFPFLKNERGELKLKGSNLLNKNLGISQNINANAIQQESINSLGRYVMLSFTYSLKGAKPPMKKP